jgi:5,10-methylenetetrahydrofolate reductase
MTGRDRNRIALQADVLGAAAIGIENFVFMSGDDPKLGNHPDAVNVKDLDGVGLVKMAVGMRDEARFLSGDEIKPATPKMLIGATASPFTKPMEADAAKTLDKIAAGAEFLQTQPVFDLPTFSRWLIEVRGDSRDVPILAGVLILRSADQAERLAKLPGLAFGPDAIDRMKKASDAEAEGIAIAVEIVKSMRSLPGVRGVHLYAIEWPEAVGRVVEAAGLLPRPEAKVPA